MNLEEVVHKGWFNMIQLHWPTLWKIEVNGNSILEFVCSGDGFRDMHLLKFIIMVKNSTSLLLESKWSCPCTCANPLHHDVPCLCMAPHLKFMVAIPYVEHLPQQLGEVQVPCQKLFEPIILLPPYKTPWISKLETIFSWNCQFVGDMKNTFLPPYAPFGLMFIFIFKTLILKAWWLIDIVFIQQSRMFISPCSWDESWTIPTFHWCWTCFF